MCHPTWSSRGRKLSPSLAAKFPDPCVSPDPALKHGQVYAGHILITTADIDDRFVRHDDSRSRKISPYKKQREPALCSVHLINLRQLLQVTANCSLGRLYYEVHLNHRHSHCPRFGRGRYAGSHWLQQQRPAFLLQEQEVRGISDYLPTDDCLY